MIISNNISGISAATSLEHVNKSSQTESSNGVKDEALEASIKSAADNAIKYPQDTVAISKEGYSAVAESSQTSSVASESSSVSQTASVVSTEAKLTALEEEYDTDVDGKLSTMEKKAMAETLAKKEDAVSSENIVSSEDSD